jgi:hypothetical protein
LRINVKVKPSSRKNEVKLIDNNKLEIRVTAAPDKGKANKAVVELLAKHFKVPKSAITIVRGEGARDKVIEINV